MIINDERKISKKNIHLPDFILAGYPRCGTTSLYQYLFFHPQILLSTPKEPRFFLLYDIDGSEESFETEEIKKNSITSLDRYNQLYKKGRNKVCGDMTVSYMKHTDRFISNVKKVYPQGKKPKLLVALRNPIEAAFSYFNYQQANGQLRDIDFMAWIKQAKENKDAGFKNIGITSSIFDFYDYPTHLEELKKEFDEIYIYLLSDMEKDPARIMNEIFDFLGVKRILPDDLGNVYNRAGKLKTEKPHWVIHHKTNPLKNIIAKIIPEAKGRKWLLKKRESQFEKAVMGEQEKAFLMDNFLETINQTSKLLERDLSGWLEI